MYASTLIGLQWSMQLALLDRELALADLPMTDVDDLLEQRQRITDALFYSGEAPTA